MEMIEYKVLEQDDATWMDGESGPLSYTIEEADSGNETLDEEIQLTNLATAVLGAMVLPKGVTRLNPSVVVIDNYLNIYRVIVVPYAEAYEGGRRNVVLVRKHLGFSSEEFDGDSITSITTDLRIAQGE